MAGCCENIKTCCIIYFTLAIFSVPGWISAGIGLEGINNCPLHWFIPYWTMIFGFLILGFVWSSLIAICPCLGCKNKVCKCIRKVLVIIGVIMFFLWAIWLIIGTIFYAVTDTKSSDPNDKNYCSDDVFIMFGIDVLVSWGFIVYFGFGAICGSKSNAHEEDTSMVVQTVSVSYIIYYEFRGVYIEQEESTNYPA